MWTTIFISNGKFIFLPVSDPYNGVAQCLAKTLMDWVVCLIVLSCGLYGVCDHLTHRGVFIWHNLYTVLSLFCQHKSCVDISPNKERYSIKNMILFYIIIFCK